MVTAAIIQARLGSTRLPGKVLMDIAGRSVLWHTLTRCIEIPGVDIVCCATTTEPEDDVVAVEGEACGAAVYRGDPDDVLGRYLEAAIAIAANRVVRVTADCPLIDPEVCGNVLRLQEDPQIDFATNNLETGWPHGLDCEAFSTDLLAEAAKQSTQAEEREHVTPWIRRNPIVRMAHLPGPGGPPAEFRWTLDYPEDLEFFRRLIELSPPPPHRGWRHFAELLECNPEIAVINRQRHQPRLHDTGYRQPEG